MKLPKLPKMPIPDKNWNPIFIGDFAIGPVHDGNFWIEHRSGEGMHVKSEILEKLIADFYKESF